MKRKWLIHWFGSLMLILVGSSCLTAQLGDVTIFTVKADEITSESANLYLRMGGTAGDPRYLNLGFDYGIDPDNLDLMADYGVDRLDAHQGQYGPWAPVTTVYWDHYAFGEGGSWYNDRIAEGVVSEPVIILNVDGLIAETTYYFQAIAFDHQNSQTFFGEQMSFTTGASISSVPEPSTYAMIFGLAALGFVLVRKRRVG